MLIATAKKKTSKSGDPVYLKNHRRTNKLDVKWTPYYRIIDQTGPLSFIVRSQLDGTTTKTHARHIRPAKIDEWKVPKDEQGNIIRRATYVVPPEQSEEESDEEETALKKVLQHRQQEREDSSDEDDIPLMELRRRWRSKATPPKPDDELVLQEQSQAQKQHLELQDSGPRANTPMNIIPHNLRMNCRCPYAIPSNKKMKRDR